MERNSGSVLTAITAKPLSVENKNIVCFVGKITCILVGFKHSLKERYYQRRLYRAREMVFRTMERNRHCLRNLNTKHRKLLHAGLLFTRVSDFTFHIPPMLQFTNQVF